MQAPKPPVASESSERRISREKGPAPPPPSAIRHEPKNEDKENSLKTADKQSAMELLEHKKPTSPSKTTPEVNGESKKSPEKKVLTTENTEKQRRFSADNKPIVPEKNKNTDSRSKSVEGKKPRDKTNHLLKEEKRKSAPVQPESIGEWNDQSHKKEPFLEENR